MFTHFRGGIVRNVTYPNGATKTRELNAHAQVSPSSLTTPTGKVWSINRQYYTPTIGGVTYTTNVMGNLIYESIDRTFSYTYDGSGNISKITDRQGTNSTEKTYQYDELNQLIRENDPVAGKTTTYTYDNGGNILTKTEYAYTTGALGTPTNTINYTYGNTEWKDLLTAYNGQNITYDQIGNPLTYYNGTQFTWNYGRKLATATTADGTQISYKYNDSGIRTQKTVGGVATDYFLDGSRIVAQKTGNNATWYYYDGDGTREAIEYGGNVYYYFYNAQGDVVGLFDNNLNVVVEYSYDSWGNVLSITGSLANTLGQDNPFRYRGYYYDSDTGLYYLNSRYYDANTGRFVNADNITDGGSGLIGANVFIYAANNPIMNSDPSGNWIIKNAIKWAAKNVVRPVFKAAKQYLGKTNATYSQGVNISGTPSAFSFNLQAGISIDTKGNIAIQSNFSGGVTSGNPSASVSLYRTKTNAPSIKKLEGTGAQVGGSIATCIYGIPLYAGADFNIIPDDELDKLYVGTTSSIGVGTPGAEVHVEWGETKTLNATYFNIFDIAEGVYVKIMEW